MHIAREPLLSPDPLPSTTPVVIDMDNDDKAAAEKISVLGGAVMMIEIKSDVPGKTHPVELAKALTALDQAEELLADKTKEAINKRRGERALAFFMFVIGLLLTIGGSILLARGNSCDDTKCNDPVVGGIGLGFGFIISLLSIILSRQTCKKIPAGAFADLSATEAETMEDHLEVITTVAKSLGAEKEASAAKKEGV